MYLGLYIYHEFEGGSHVKYVGESLDDALASTDPNGENFEDECYRCVQEWKDGKIVRSLLYSVQSNLLIREDIYTDIMFTLDVDYEAIVPVQVIEHGSAILVQYEDGATEKIPAMYLYSLENKELAIADMEESYGSYSER